MRMIKLEPDYYFSIENIPGSVRSVVMLPHITQRQKCSKEYNINKETSI